jgi:protein-disulfide isomerase
MKRIRMWRTLCVAVPVIASVFAFSVSAQDSETCANYPEFCVPQVGRVPAHMTSQDWSSVGDGGSPVVRGMTGEGLFFLGDPAAPIHFLVFHSFTCSHCSGYYQIELIRFVEDYVLTGQAALHVALLSFSMQPYSDYAAQAAICAGEQGAFWEMQHELFVRGSREGVTAAFTPDAIQGMARDLSLDADRLWACVESGQYAFLMDQFKVLAQDLGVSATPTVLVLDGSDWQKVIRNYDNLAQLTNDANAVIRSAH